MKRAVIALTAVALIFSLTGCGKKSDEEKLQDAAKSAQTDAAKKADTAKKDASKALNKLTK